MLMVAVKIVTYASALYKQLRNLNLLTFWWKGKNRTHWKDRMGPRCRNANQCKEFELSSIDSREPTEF